MAKRSFGALKFHKSLYGIVLSGGPIRIREGDDFSICSSGDGATTRAALTSFLAAFWLRISIAQARRRGAVQTANHAGFGGDSCRALIRAANSSGYESL